MKQPLIALAAAVLSAAKAVLSGQSGAERALREPRRPNSSAERPAATIPSVRRAMDPGHGTPRGPCRSIGLL